MSSWSAAFRRKTSATALLNGRLRTANSHPPDSSPNNLVDSVQMKITAAMPGKVNFELPIQKQHTNRLGILHGATIATMVDTSGSLALASRGLYSTGVSIDLNVTYLNSGGKVGDTIRGEVTCDKCRSLPLLLLDFADCNDLSREDTSIYLGKVHQQRQ